MKRKLNGLKATGNGSYTDNVGRTIYGDLKNKKAYIIDKESKRIYILVSNRLFLSISLGVIAAYYINLYIGIGIAIVLFAISELYFRFCFLPSLDCFEDVDFPSKSNMRQMIENKKDINIYLLIITDIALSVLLFLNAKNILATKDVVNDMNSMLIIIASLGIIIFSLYMAITAIIVIIKRKSS